MSKQQSKKPSRLASLALVAGALITWIASRMRWVEATTVDDKAGQAVHDIVGATWSVELMALAAVFLAGAVAVLALRKTARRIVGGIVALAGAAGTYGPLMLLVQGADLERARGLLSSGATSGKAQDPIKISEWAQVTQADVSFLGPVLAILGCAIAVVAGVVVAMRPGEDSPQATKYERAATRREKLEEELETSPESGRVLWDALDAGIDPTDAQERH